MHRIPLVPWLPVLAAALLATAARGQNLVANGRFDSDLSSWGGAQPVDTAREARLSDLLVGPEPVDDLLLGDHPPRRGHEQAQQRERLGRERHRAPVAGQMAVGGQPKRSETKHPGAKRHDPPSRRSSGPAG